MPRQARIKDLVGRMTLSEKVSQMLHESPAIERLGIGPFSWWNEGLHGVARAGSATVFPQAIGLAATFDRDLVYRVATAVSDEARAKHRIFKARSTGGRYVGLTFWTPNINIFRDPRWGRGQETYGEDPFLTGEIGVMFVRGLQGKFPDRLKTAACAKHFAVHSGPERERHSFNAEVSPFDLEDTYLPAFHKLVTEAAVESVMGAYNRTNGEPCCGSSFLLEKTLRVSWGFQGHVTSDCWAIQDFHLHHKVTAGPVESAALAVNRGCDLNCGNLYHHLEDAVKLGLVTEETIDRSLGRLFSTRFRLGEFDSPETDPWSMVPAERIRCQEHLELADEAARCSMVLLKNNGVLPLDKTCLRSLYLTGPNAMAAEALLGNYHGLSPRLVSFAEGIIEAAGHEIKMDFRHGALLWGDKKNSNDWAVFEAREFEVIIACMGLNILLEGEEGDAIAGEDMGDRPTAALPQGQHEFLMRLLDLGRPVVLVVAAGSPVILTPYVEKAAAVIYTWYPGERGGKALADLLFGHSDFSGRLPVTLLRNLDDLPPFEDYSMKNRTYRYSQAEPLFSFGYGLCYRPLVVQDFQVPLKVAEGCPLVVEIKVYNPHKELSSDVVQVYLRKETGLKAAIRELAAFSKVSLEPGEVRTIVLEIPGRQLLSVLPDGTRTFRPGNLKIWAGTNQPDQRSQILRGPTLERNLVLSD